MNIIFTTYEAKEIGGSYLRSLSLAQGLTELNHQLTLWTSAKNFSLKPKISFEGKVKVIESIGIFPYRFRKGGYDPFDVIFRSIIIIFAKCDVIHSFNHRPASTIPALVKSIISKKTKWFLDWADLWGKGGIADRRRGPLRFLTSNLDHYAEQYFIKRASFITAISDDLVKKAKKIRGKKKNVYFLGVGANVNGIDVISQIKARSKLRLAKNKKILVYLFVGTYDEELLANTFIALNKLRSDVLLMLLGPRMPNFEKMIALHQSLTKKVLRKGIVKREMLSWYLAAGDLMLLPFANKEINLGKFPNKLGDYLAAGRPIISNPTGEIKKVFLKYKVGVLVPEDPELFAKNIDQILDDQKKLNQLGKEARILAEQLSWLTVSKQLETFYLN